MPCNVTKVSNMQQDSLCICPFLTLQLPRDYLYRLSKQLQENIYNSFQLFPPSTHFQMYKISQGKTNKDYCIRKTPLANDYNKSLQQVSLQRHRPYSPPLRIQTKLQEGTFTSHSTGCLNKIDLEISHTQDSTQIPQI